MIAHAETQVLQPVDVYLGFEIVARREDLYVAVPRGWRHAAPVILEASSLPAIRERIWAWWHRLLD